VVSAMELALALEKLVNEKLHNLHSVSCSSMPTYIKIIGEDIPPRKNQMNFLIGSYICSLA
jgi:hypothetical protein